MNGKQAEEKSGITRRNLRFYEQQGLIHPSRNPDNDYRDYSETDIETLKKIRALRMLDVSLEDISSVLNEKKTLQQVMSAQEEILRKRQQELDTAIRFCKEMQVRNPDFNELLQRMDAPEVRPSLFGSWIRDYQSVARAEAKIRFSFNADKDVVTVRDFTMALLKYGEKEHKDIVITREGMMPEFTIDGIEYTAERECYYGDPNCPSDVVICEAVHPEDFETDVKEGRSKIMRFFCHWWWTLPAFLFEFCLGAGILFEEKFSLGLRFFMAFASAAVVLIWLLILERVIYPRKKK